MQSLLRSGTLSAHSCSRVSQQRPVIARPAVTAVQRSGSSSKPAKRVVLRKETHLDLLQDSVVDSFLGQTHLSTGLNSWETVGRFPLHGVNTSCSILSSSSVAGAPSTPAAAPSTPGSRPAGHPVLQPNMVFCDTLLAGLRHDGCLVSAFKISKRAEQAIDDMVADFAADVSQQAQQQRAQQEFTQQAEAQQHNQQQTWAQRDQEAWEKAQQQEAWEREQQRRQQQRQQQCQQQREQHTGAEPQQDAQQQYQQPPRFDRQHSAVFAVYRSSPGSAHQPRQQQFVQLLRLPEQKLEYLSALQEGLEVVPLSEAVNLPGGASDAESAEQLAAQQQQQCSSKVGAAGAQGANHGQQQTNMGSATRPSQQRIKVEVCVQLCTQPGEDVVLVGSHASLGSWSLDGAVPLTWTDGHFWRASIELPAGVGAIEYKAVVKTAGGVCWEAGANHVANLEGSSSHTLQHTFKSC